MIYLADSGIKVHTSYCRFVTPAYPVLGFGSALNARKWAAKQKRTLCKACKPLGEGHDSNHNNNPVP